jgi:hypothetical protein
MAVPVRPIALQAIVLQSSIAQCGRISVGEHGRQQIELATGAVLIFVGIIAVCFQSFTEINNPTAAPVAPNELQARPTDFSIKTRFPGLELIIIGALLETVGFFGSRPWKGSQNSD